MMGLPPFRAFLDIQGNRWEVTEIRPRVPQDRRSGGDRRATARAFTDRRREEAGAGDGWLLFECAGERRRLRPVPEGWTRASIDELEMMLAAAAPGGHVRRLICDWGRLTPPPGSLQLDSL